ncbi:MAG: PAS domain-containing protein, partial [Cytophagaceae bacterium]
SDDRPNHSPPLAPSGNVAHANNDIEAMKQRLLLKREALSALESGIIITDPRQPDNPIIYVSPGFIRLTGYSAEEAIGRNCRFLQGLDTDLDAVTQIRQAVRDKRSCRVTLLNYRKDGSTFWNDLAISVFQKSHGPGDPGTIMDSAIHFVGVQADVTEWVRYVEERNAHDQFAIDAGKRVGEILNTMSDGFFSVDLTWTIMYANAQAETLWARPITELIGKSLWEAFPEAVGTRFWHECHRAMRDSTEVAIEILYSRRETWFSVRLLPQEQGLSIFFRDVTEKRQQAHERTNERKAAVATARKALDSNGFQDQPLLVGTGGMWNFSL